MAPGMLVPYGNPVMHLLWSSWDSPKEEPHLVVLSHPAWGVSVVVHGDDFTALGTPDGLDKYEQGMAEAFECKLKGAVLKCVSE